LGNGKADSDGDGQISVGELYQWLKPRVVQTARLVNRDQTPRLIVGEGGRADRIVLSGRGP
jgi:hypothetical protein